MKLKIKFIGKFEVVLLSCKEIYSGERAGFRSLEERLSADQQENCSRKEENDFYDVKKSINYNFCNFEILKFIKIVNWVHSTFMYL